MAMKSADCAPKFVSARDPKGRMMMQLHIFKGSFVTADTGAGEQCPMNAAVWSRMPEDLMWRVVQFVPAVKQFQWQLVSRQWRQMLTSHGFRKRLVAMAAARSGRGAAGGAVEQRAVIAYVMPFSMTATDQANGSTIKVVDIDLSFVPSWFWKSDSYTTLAAMDGLVCLSNQGFQKSDWWPNIEYCVINPLTRTCKVLPKVPFAPHAFVWSSRPMVITGFQEHDGQWHDKSWMMATHDLEGAGQWTLIDGLGPLQLLPASTVELPDPEFFALCDGETFYRYNDLLHLITAAEGASLTTVPLKWPEFLDLDWLKASSFTCYKEAMSCFVAHRGSIFLIAELVQLGPGPAMLCGIWRLVRSRMAWEAVAGLEKEEVHRLIRPKHASRDCHVLCSASRAGDHLCLQFVLQNLQNRRRVDSVRITVGFSLKTRTWELLYDDDGRFWPFGKLFQLLPDSFLL